MMIEINKAKNAIELEELSRARKALSFVKRANEKLQQSDASTKPQAMQSAPIVQRPAANEAGVRHSALPLFANAVIARCRELLLMEKPKCAATLKDYRAKFQLFEGRLQPPDGASEGDRWARPLLAYSGTRRSYRLNRAAVLWGLRQKISANLDRLESALAGGCSREVSWRHDISMLKALAETHDALGSIAYQPKTSEGVEKVGSKRRDLRIIRKAVPNWASVMEEAMARRKYLDATTTLRLAGVRPEDLVGGVQVKKCSDHEVAIHVRNGTKVTALAGQPWRTVIVPVKFVPERWLNRLRAESEFLVQIQSTDRLRAALQEVSERVLPNLPYATAYVFRHDFATRLREDGRDAEEIGAFLGHSAAETQNEYGWKTARGKRRKPAQMTGYRVVVPREVRPLDRTGLKKVLSTSPRSKTDRQKP